MMSMTRFRRFTAAASLTALAVSGAAVATTTSAFGVEVGTESPAAATPTFTPIPAKASLTVHKHKQTTEQGAEGNGLAMDPAPAGEVLKGVEFTLYRVASSESAGRYIDLATNQGWADAETLSKAYKAGTAKLTLSEDKNSGTLGDYALTKVKSVTTGEDGAAAFGEQDRALYVVVESNASGAQEQVNGKWQDVKVRTAAPFIVALPMTYPDVKNDTSSLTKWNTDVHVYPKNTARSEVEKEVVDAGKNLGDTVTYTVKGDINDGDVAAGLTQYAMRDQLNEHLEYTADSATMAIIDSTVTADEDGSEVIKKVTVKEGDPASDVEKDVTLAKGADYEITNPESSNENTLTITFTETGLAKLSAAKKANVNAKARLTFTAKVKDLPGDGKVPNQATVFGNDGNVEQNSGGEPSNTVESRFTKVKFKKTTSDGTTVLPGAEFILTVCDDPATKEVDESNGKAPIAINGVSKWTSAEGTGEFTIDGIHVSDWVDGVQVDTNQTQYCLFETKAPKDYELLTEAAAKFTPLSLAAESSDGSHAISAAAWADVTAQNGGVIKNYPKNGGFNLPLTGAQGLATAGITGALLVAGGYVLVVRRRREEEAA